MKQKSEKEEVRGVKGDIQMSEDTHDAGETVHLQNVQELESFLRE